MGIKFFPGLRQAGIDPSTVEKLKEIQRVPLDSAKRRKEKIISEKGEVDKLAGLISELDVSLSGLKTRYDFYKLKLDSSHPDIIDGVANAGAMIGTYEMEVRAMARAEKELAYGFPDKDDTPVGFGFMLIERDDGEPVEVVVEPYTTLQDLATQINDSDAGVRAMVINTKYKPDSYRLLVISEDSGREAQIYLDEDTTFLEFKEQVTGRNLDVLFEDVPVTDEDNVLDELISEVTLNVRRSEPGTRVQVSIIYDIDATVEAIKGFVEKYNQVASFINDQFVENPQTGQYGKLSGDSSIKYIMRQLQSTVIGVPKFGEKYNTLADIGVTTNPKSGSLDIDESKVRAALTEDYESVARIFIRSPRSTGIAELMAQKLRNFRDPAAGVLKTRMRGLERIMDNQDQEIARRERQLEQQEQAIDRRFSALEGTLAGLKGQQDFLRARFGGAPQK